MSWLKMGRWVLVGLIGLTSAAACGGRGSLPIAGYDDGEGGESSFGGTNPIGGSSSGTSGKGGSGGAPSCKAGTTFCQGNSVANCDATGKVSGSKVCPKGLTCVASGGGGASCVNQVCKPKQASCDSTGTLVQVCSADGSSLSTTTDCSQKGLICNAGKCVEPSCKANTLFCDKTGVRLCNNDGTGSSAWVNCAPDQYCDAASLSCKQGICTPNQPVCKGTVATICNADGSGYLSKATDCAAQEDRRCVNGACQCDAGLADCDGNTRNGCETVTATDPDNCLGCNNICSSNNIVTRTCSNGCSGACQSGFLDCNSDKQKDGCEVSSLKDAKNCGGCGDSCSTNHITASCVMGDCETGTCSANFADCNLDKRKDGCEASLLTDAANCGQCGKSCSTSHLTPSCSGGVCDGTCKTGFADCNLDKQADGCEINTQTDPLNCGTCNTKCASGESCSNGKCVALLTFTGVAQNVAVSALIGWTECFREVYGSGGTALTTITQDCSGSLMMMACQVKGASTLQLAAYAPRTDVMFDTGADNVTHDANGVSWYFSNFQSWGFAPQGDPVTRTTCDTQDSSIGSGGVDGDKRLCWHTSSSTTSAGWRCGRNDQLNNDMTYERVLYTAK